MFRLPALSTLIPEVWAGLCKQDSLTGWGVEEALDPNGRFHSHLPWPIDGQCGDGHGFVITVRVAAWEG